jgi:NADPH:quinone reductase-like Zn-dependent oxidoreductase
VRPVVLADAGCYVSTGGDAAAVASTIAAAVFTRLMSRQRAIPFTLNGSAQLWTRLAELAQRRVLRAHIERSIALDEVADAMRGMETGHGRGKIVVRL